MRARLWFVPLVLAALLAAGAAVAEPIGPHWQFTPFAGFTIFDPDLRYPASNLPLTDNLHVGGRLGYQSRSWLGLEAAVGFTPTTTDVSVDAKDYDWLHASGNLMLSPTRGRWGNPFVFAGFGATQLKPAAGEKRTTNTIEFGAGEQVWMTDEIGLRLEARDVSFKPLQNTGGQTYYHNIVLGVGITFALGAIPRDTDADGVPDKQDKCPGLQEDLDEFQDEDGCPDPDNDRDGIPDEADMCPMVWGVKSADPATNGCPVTDKDGDGVVDSADKCPDQAEDKDGFEDGDGCPDLDNDADDVPDAEDACPDKPGPASSNPKWNGCPVPDADGDTFDDEADKCPSEAETWNGVKDDDGCPDPGGVPLVTVRTTAAGPALVLRSKIDFKGPDSAPEVDPKSIPTVRAIAAELNKHPSWVVAIGARPNPAHRALADTEALSRSFAVVLALRTSTFRDGVAETVGWSAVKDQPGAATQGVGILVLGDAAAPAIA